jgi:hypothetical protein
MTNDVMLIMRYDVDLLIGLTTPSRGPGLRRPCADAPNRRAVGWRHHRESSVGADELHVATPAPARATRCRIESVEFI